MNADLENVKITRINSISNGDGRLGTNINLLKAFEQNGNY